ncbi:hypothetical protein PVAP13_4NG146171 [Panicum virgatum]|uniref:Uncharacterized protein n=1 Tax=Panicum virgatum TaxID=38727 RepID=A0A8T0T8V1_PANVG|nr:hypothetical protein PVAP13_4NG146171 [Panicum virgatum]
MPGATRGWRAAARRRRTPSYAATPLGRRRRRCTPGAGPGSGCRRRPCGRTGHVPPPPGRPHGPVCSGRGRVVLLGPFCRRSSVPGRGGCPSSVPGSRPGASSAPGRASVPGRRPGASSAPGRGPRRCRCRLPAAHAAQAVAHRDPARAAASLAAAQVVTPAAQVQAFAGPHPQPHPAVMLAAAAPMFAPFWTPPAPPSQ